MEKDELLFCGMCIGFLIGVFVYLVWEIWLKPESQTPNPPPVKTLPNSYRLVEGNSINITWSGDGLKIKTTYVLQDKTSTSYFGYAENESGTVLTTFNGTVPDKVLTPEAAREHFGINSNNVIQHLKNLPGNS